MLIPIINLFNSLNYCILRYGFVIFDGGLGLNCYLFSGVVAVVMWGVAIRGKQNLFGGYLSKGSNNIMKVYLWKKQEYYTGYTLSLFAMIGTFILWPNINYNFASLSSTQTYVNSSIKST